MTRGRTFWRAARQRLRLLEAHRACTLAHVLPGNPRPCRRARLPPVPTRCTGAQRGGAPRWEGGRASDTRG